MKKKVILSLIIIILVLVAIVLTYYIFTNNSKVESNEEPENIKYFSDYIFKYDSSYNLYIDQAKDELTIEKDKNFVFKIFTREKSYEERVKIKDSLTDSVKNSGYEITKPISETTINNIKLLYFEYQNSTDKYIAGYTQKSENDVWSFLGNISDTNTSTALSYISEILANVEKMPTSQKIDIENQNISFKIPNGFYRYATFDDNSNEVGNIIDKKYYSYKYAYLDNTSNQYTDAKVTYLNKDSLTYYPTNSDGETYKSYKTLDQVLQDEIQNLKDKTSYNTLDISDVQTINVNNKELKYFDVKYSYDEYDGVKNLNKIIALDKDDAILKYEFSTFKSGYTLDFETLKNFFEIDEK